MKYKQLGEKFFINVPVIPNNDFEYIDCYVYGYIHKKPNSFSCINKNLEIGKYKLKKSITKLIKFNCIKNLEDKIYENLSGDNIFYKFEESHSYDRTYIPNLKFLNIKQNAIFWKLYKYSDPVEGMKDYYTIGTKSNIQKINYEYIAKVLNLSLYYVKNTIKHLKELKLIKTQPNKSSFYFGIQPIKTELKIYWHDEEKNIENLAVSQDSLLNIYKDKN